MPAVEWARTDGACPADTSQRSTWPANRVPGTTYTVDAAMTLAPFCVWAVARDIYGAASVDTLSATPINHPPVAKLDVVSPTQAPPYPFLSQFRLSGMGSTDAEMDPLTFGWKMLRQPAGSQAQLGPCADAATNTRLHCLASDLPGDYVAELAVNDGTDTTKASVTLTVLEDKLPCIVRTSPDFGAGAAVHTLGGDGDMAVAEDVFSVLQVDDDLDPWPSLQSQLRFRWSVARNDTPLTSQGTDGPSLHLPTNAFRIGDTARVRVEIADRDNGPEIDRALLACPDDVCAAGTDRAYAGHAGCLLRVTWTVEYR